MYHVAWWKEGRISIKTIRMDCYDIRSLVSRRNDRFLGRRNLSLFVFIRLEWRSTLSRIFVHSTRINSYIMQPRIPASTRSPCASAETANDHFVARRCTRCGRFSPTNLLGRRFYNFFLCESRFRIRHQQ